MKNDVRRRPRLLPLLILFIALFAGAQVYKWVDDKGQVHFGDRPPDQQATEEIELPEGPSERETAKAKEDLDKTLGARRMRDEAIQEEKADRIKERELRVAKDDADFKMCVEAIQQSEVLKLKVRIFKLNSDWSRSYLENEDRPLEISKLVEDVKAYCKSDMDSVKNQHSARRLLGKALNIKCVNTKEALATKKLDPGKQAEYQKFLRINCPVFDPRGFWIADWILL